MRSRRFGVPRFPREPGDIIFLRTIDPAED